MLYPKWQAVWFFQWVRSTRDVQFLTPWKSSEGRVPKQSGKVRSFTILGGVGGSGFAWVKKFHTAISGHILEVWAHFHFLMNFL